VERHHNLVHKAPAKAEVTEVVEAKEAEDQEDHQEETEATEAMPVDNHKMVKAKAEHQKRYPN